MRRVLFLWFQANAGHALDKNSQLTKAQMHSYHLFLGLGLVYTRSRAQSAHSLDLTRSRVNGRERRWWSLRLRGMCLAACQRPDARHTFTNGENAGLTEPKAAPRHWVCTTTRRRHSQRWKWRGRGRRSWPWRRTQRERQRCRRNLRRRQLTRRQRWQLRERQRWQLRRRFTVQPMPQWPRPPCNRRRRQRRMQRRGRRRKSLRSWSS